MPEKRVLIPAVPNARLDPVGGFSVTLDEAKRHLKSVEDAIKIAEHRDFEFDATRFDRKDIKTIELCPYGEVQIRGRDVNIGISPTFVPNFFRKLASLYEDG